MSTTTLSLGWAARMLRDAPHLPPRRWIYFIQAGGDDGPIKIGVAIDPADRIRTLQQGSPIPLRLISVYRGFAFEEKQLHEQFAASRISGEWFKATPDLIEYVQAFAEFHALDLEEMLAS